MERRTDVSVIILVYNHEMYLEQALDSVLMQKTDCNLEVLVGEDASPDGSADILRRYEDAYPGFFTVFYRSENMGGTKNAYDLLSRAKGRYIAFLEGDDFWTDERKIQKQADFLEHYPEYQGWRAISAPLTGRAFVQRKSASVRRLKGGRLPGQIF